MFDINDSMVSLSSVFGLDILAIMVCSVYLIDPKTAVRTGQYCYLYLTLTIYFIEVQLVIDSHVWHVELWHRLLHRGQRHSSLVVYQTRMCLYLSYLLLYLVLYCFLMPPLDHWYILNFKNSEIRTQSELLYLY